MKRLIYSVVGVVVLMSFIVKTNAQKVKFAGTVTFSIQYSGDIDPQKHVSRTYKNDVFGNKVKQTINNGQAMIYVITDGDSAKQTVLFEVSMMNIKAGYTEKAENDETKIKQEIVAQSDKDKTICNYACKCYKITITDLEDDETHEILVWTTTEIGESEAINSTTYKGLQGFPLCTAIEKDGVTTTVEATEVKKGKLKAIDFLVPSDYKMFASEDEFQTWIQQTFGGDDDE